jgi:hypothetical protein
MREQSAISFQQKKGEEMLRHSADEVVCIFFSFHVLLIADG